MTGAIEASSGGPESAMKIEAALVDNLNLADFQNAVPLLRELVLVNNLDTKIDGVEVHVSSVPPFHKPRRWHLDSISQGQRCRVTDLDLNLDGTVFARLTEAELATVEILVQRASDGTLLARHEALIELLPRNQWGGLSHLPEMVSAFVQPNEPAVERLLKHAADVLRNHGKDPSLSGYKGGPKRAWEIMSSLWTAVAAMGLDYSLPPASFEQTGQKVRGPSQIAEAGLATCLDLSLLFCSAAEQAGLNPLIVFTKEHAFAGIWLKPEEFSTAVVDDVTALRKRVKLNELVLFETTLVVQRPAPMFSYAAEVGANHITDGQPDSFVLAVDVRRARMQRIKPLASPESHQIESQHESLPMLEPVFEEAPNLLDEVSEDRGIVEPELGNLEPKDRLARWQRKLLDLSLRNNLLNFKGGKKSLRLEAPDPGALEDLLSDGQAMRLLPMPELMDGADPRSLEIYEGREREHVRREHALDALQRREIFVGLPKDDLEARLVEQFRAARTTLQEGGANALFLALGFLNWTRDDKTAQRYRAPLVLVPVTLNRKSARSGFTLTLHDDEPRFNPTLIEMLRQDYNLSLGVVDGELPKDDAGLDIAGIWKKVSHAIKDIKGWEVTEEVVLAMFSFAKYLMWKDLVERTDQLRENPVVRHLIDTPREAYASSTEFPEPRRLDHDYGPEHAFCPLAADSSQLSAILAASRGKDFVLIGPPGTGKSQTIANLIAQCLGEGKRVLFVSEKIAALNVVYRRLREVGLGEFCLEIHSNKAKKLDILGQLQQSWNAQGTVDPLVWQTEARRLKKLRDQLNVYVERLHHRHRNGLSIFQAIGSVADGAEVPKANLSWDTADAHSPADLDNLRELVDRLDVNAQALGQEELQHHPLADIRHRAWSPLWQQRLIEAIRNVGAAAEQIEQTYDRLAGSAGLPRISLSGRTRSALAVVVKNIPYAYEKDWRFVLRSDARILGERLNDGALRVARHRQLSSELSPPWPGEVLSACHHGLSLLRQRRSAFDQLGTPWPQETIHELRKGLGFLEALAQSSAQLSVSYSERVESLDLVQLQAAWIKANTSIWPLSVLRKRTIRKVLAEVTSDGRIPDSDKDIHTLVKIRTLRAKITALETGPATQGGIWTGLTTKMEFVQSALKFQQALLAAREDRPWVDAGLDPIAQGNCGAHLTRDLTRMRAIAALDAKLLALDVLGPATEGLWKGLSTQDYALEAAIRFQESVQVIRGSGSLVGDHEAVARGDCGPAMAADYQRLRQRMDLETALQAVEDLSALSAGLWKGLNTPLEEVAEALQFQARVAPALAVLEEQGAGPESPFKAALGRLLHERNQLLGPGGPIVTEGQAFVAAVAALEPKLDRMINEGQVDEDTASTFAEIAPRDLADRCSTIVAAEPQIHAWCAWQKVREDAALVGLAPLVAILEDGSVGTGNIRRVFETNYCRWWLNTVVENEEVIRSFVSAEHEKRIGDFRALDDRFTALTRAWVRANLCGNLPSPGGVTRNSEWGLLRHEMTKKKRHLPLRELLTRIPTVINSLAPCLLMSPLSIAQYLATDANTFDLVVFDEASQIPVWDAVGAMARGKQVVMVGDPKQLPPTNFFGRAESDLDEEDVEGDLESVLDECLGANLPVQDLRWHYRSRHESLITFSNHHYYRGSLVTFPSPATQDNAVRFNPVKGIYDKGASRTNLIEARALVSDLVERLNSKGFRDSKLTIGVVTFNAEQQSLIEDLLDAERRKNPAIEVYFSDSELEPVFVKNLESVQGDERDIMYFSITFGPDLAGGISMNFGPMNRDGGERRLNVAITRARHELRVFSSLRPEQFDLTRTQAIGVRDLKYFLEYAERGPRALAESSRVLDRDFDSPFEEAVASSLATKGWMLHRQVGVSAFRIDLAVVHPDAPGTYLTGIECDGATYHRSATARDRDKLREHVLRGLGWEILRIWSTDWWINPKGTLAAVHLKLNALLEASRITRSEMAEKSSALGVSAEEDTAKPAIDGEESTVIASSPLKVTASITPIDATPIRQPEAQVANSRRAETALDPEAFFSTAYDRMLSRMVAQIIEQEGPILDAVLARRVARNHGWHRTGSRIQDRVVTIARRGGHPTTREDVGTFFWAASRPPDGSPVQFRRTVGESIRTVDEICIMELKALAHDVLAAGMDGEEALIAMARDLGLKRLRAVSRNRLERALAAAGNGT